MCPCYAMDMHFWLNVGGICGWWEYIAMYMCFWLNIGVYVVDESMWCLKWEMDLGYLNCFYTWKEFVQVWLMELKWDDDYMLLLCIVKGW